jgi:hypothetical protein
VIQISILKPLPPAIAPETLIFAGGDFVAFEGVSTGIDQAEIAHLTETVKARFDKIRMWRFQNEIGAVSYFWQAWKSSLTLNAWTFDGKIATAQLPLKEPRWAEFRAANSQYDYALAHRK